MQALNNWSTSVFLQKTRQKQFFLTITVELHKYDKNGTVALEY